MKCSSIVSLLIVAVFTVFGLAVPIVDTGSKGGRMPRNLRVNPREQIFARPNPLPPPLVVPWSTSTTSTSSTTTWTIGTWMTGTQTWTTGTWSSGTWVTGNTGTWASSTPTPTPDSTWTSDSSMISDSTRTSDATWTSTWTTSTSVIWMTRDPDASSMSVNGYYRGGPPAGAGWKPWKRANGPKGRGRIEVTPVDIEDHYHLAPVLAPSEQDLGAPVQTTAPAPKGGYY